MPDAHPLVPIIRRQSQDINTLYRTLGDSIQATIARQRLVYGTDRPITEADRKAIMQAVREGCDVIWGSTPGGESAMGEIVTRDTRLAMLAPLNDAVLGYSAAMTQTLRERLVEDANG